MTGDRMFLILSLLLLPGIALTTAYGSALAATIYVGPGETFTNIQAGIDAAVDRDVVIVRDGIYKGFGNRNIKFHVCIHTRFFNQEPAWIVPGPF